MNRRNSRTAQDLVAQLADLLGTTVSLVHAHEREWASITFSGSRHRLIFEVPELAVESAPVQRALAALPDHEFRLRGEIVADCTATIGMPMPSQGQADHRLLVIELLTVATESG
jgi:hypothetical protein